MNHRLLLLLASVACGCATTTGTTETATSLARDYAPIPVGGRWTYDVEYPGQKGELTVQILAEKDGYVVDNRNGAFLHTREGLRDHDRYLIRNPLQPGLKWKTIVGPSAVEHLEIVSVGAPCESSAGRFSDCLVVAGRIRRDRNMQLKIDWTWARGVGLVKLETRADIKGKGEVPQVRQSLRSYSLSGSPPVASETSDDGPDNWSRE